MPICITCTITTAIIRSIGQLIASHASAYCRLHCTSVRHRRRAFSVSLSHASVQTLLTSVHLLKRRTFVDDDKLAEKTVSPKVLFPLKQECFCVRFSVLSKTHNRSSSIFWFAFDVCFTHTYCKASFLLVPIVFLFLPKAYFLFLIIHSFVQCLLSTIFFSFALNWRDLLCLLHTHTYATGNSQRTLVLVCFLWQNCHSLVAINEAFLC